MTDYIAGAFLLIGSFFAIAAAVGLLRFPDVFSRMHAASKAGTLGSGLMLLAIPIALFGSDVAMRAIAGVVFFILTAPVSAHLLARSTYLSGIKPWSNTGIDEMKDHVDQN